MDYICSKKSISQRANALNDLKYSIGGKECKAKVTSTTNIISSYFTLPASILERKDNPRRQTHSEQPSDEEY
jgi:hypothetical protein